jgi:hypothetical protein
VCVYVCMCVLCIDKHTRTHIGIKLSLSLSRSYTLDHTLGSTVTHTRALLSCTHCNTYYSTALSHTHTHTTTDLAESGEISARFP